MSKRDEYIKKIEKQLEEWNGQIDNLQGQARTASADMKKQYAEQIETMKEKCEDLKTRLATVKDTSDDAWQDVKAGFDLAFDALSNAFNSARRRFKS